MVEDVLNFHDVLGSYPELLLWIVETLSLYVLNFVHCVLLLLPPLKFLVEEVEYDEVQAPQIISPWQILFEKWIKKDPYDVVVGVKRGERYSASEISLLSLCERRLGSVIQMLLGESEINNVNMLVVSGEYKVRLYAIRKYYYVFITALTSLWMKPRSCTYSIASSISIFISVSWEGDLLVTG